METSGVIKLAITLPNGAQVSIETEDRELARELLYSVLPQLKGASGGAAAAVNAANTEAPPYPNGNRADNGSGYATPTESQSPAGLLAAATGGETTNPASNGHPSPVELLPSYARDAASAAAIMQDATAPTVDATPGNVPVNERVRVPEPTEPATPEEREYVAFCQNVSPLGDMRRVVVAAEAADRFLAVKSVDPDELSQLFSLAGWPLPHSFVQTLRNAARTKFRWLERIPGQSGHYRVTNMGRSIVLGDNKSSLPTHPVGELAAPSPRGGDFN